MTVMEAYKKLLKEEVEVFRKRGHEFLDGTLTRAEFKGFSGGMGSYAQKETGKFMIRLRTPSGIVSREHFGLILDYAGKYGLDKIHLTTRQAVQLHDLSIDDVCDIMRDAIDQDLFTRGGGGNFPRNVSLSPMAGVDPEEVFDVTLYARQVGDYFLRNATEYKLPRKLKVAFSSSASDTGCATVNDMGFIGVLDGGKPMFRLWLAGGMGGQPALGIPYDELVAPEEVLYYVEAMVRLFMAEGDYTNKARARVRFIPRRMGAEAFMECYKKHLEEVKKECQFDGITPLVWRENVDSEKVDDASAESENPLILPQKQEGYFTVILHPLCGQLKLEEGRKIQEILSDIPDAEIRLSMDEELYIRNLSKDEAEKMLKVMEDCMMLSPIRMSVSCIGTPTCQAGVNQSQKLCQAVEKAVANAELNEDRLPKLYISGCPNCCARHPVAAMGFSGRKVKVDGVMEEAFDCFIGGHVGMDTSCFGEKVGTILASQIPEMIVELGQMLTKAKKDYMDALADGSAAAVIQKYCQA